MTTESAFSCGNSKYYVIKSYGRFIVQRQDWLERTFIGFARDLAEATELIRSDARTFKIRAA